MQDGSDEQARLDNAFCNAIVAVQGNYTFDSFEQSAMVRELATATNVDQLDAMLLKFDISGYDLDTPDVGCSPHALKTAA